MPELNEFESDTHRRVAANCTRPRSATEIALVLRGPQYHPALGKLSAHDRYVDERAYEPAGVQSYLDELEADGLVKNVGRFAHGEEALEAQDSDPDVVDFQGVRGDESVEQLVEMQDVAGDEVAEERIRKQKDGGQRDGFIGLAAHPARFPLLDAEDHYVMTVACHERLIGPSPDAADDDAEEATFRAAMLSLSPTSQNGGNNR